MGEIRDGVMARCRIVMGDVSFLGNGKGSAGREAWRNK
jgi:hypothetical protein